MGHPVYHCFAGMMGFKGKPKRGLKLSRIKQATFIARRKRTLYSPNPSPITKGFKHSTPIQELTIPIILSGTDLFAQAETGSGKTGAFAIPVLEQIMRSENKDDIYIVLSPTRELAQQTHKVFAEFGEPLGV